ncbi:MAG: 3'(2'),5'-bisphosphate nucleotidase CysQ [Sphingomonadaceae bacterium]|uniref:3'(2'),5'-bisphosphate nucleotidase CysQ family protein n=1 Tax=Thermaurantiacus sp. TaxID=2820283 RepID=UPI00298F2F76|nr:3'(2'),5'-bisphosphate nucleotidase CysQ [Thermaurantiacus sp.]MCS6986769.1 3'(2'),5'-bisphosphate nucleotidase CysQ [Sphingomonadaceae bacterium]MDW8413968.1 3'(2'),5'-bisphosphate nucleotidase CysQ [Thermaurantiacus sp.]
MAFRTSPVDPAALRQLEQAMRAAGRRIEELKRQGLVARDKADSSPVTDADVEAERILREAVLAIEPAARIIGEEGAEGGALPPPGSRFWLIDPLDGTREFLSGKDSYTVNLALVVEGVPVVGLVLHPPSARLWTGVVGQGASVAERDGPARPVRTRPLAASPALVVSHTHLDAQTRAWAEAVPQGRRTAAGSSIKFCVLAEGEADAYPRFGWTMEWDTAAGDALLRAAGGITLADDGRPLRYGKPGYRNGAFLALGDPEAARRLPPFGMASARAG